MFVVNSVCTICVCLMLSFAHSAKSTSKSFCKTSVDTQRFPIIIHLYFPDAN